MLKSATHTELKQSQMNAEEAHNSAYSEPNPKMTEGINTELPKPYEYGDTGFWIRPVQGKWYITLGNFGVYEPQETSDECEGVIDRMDWKLLHATIVASISKLKTIDIAEISKNFVEDTENDN